MSVPKIQDLYADIDFAKSNDALMTLLNQPPKKEWIKKHPYIANYFYLPIDKIEYLLKKIFKKYRIEIIREGVAFNGVYVVVRVHYLNPITNEFDYHDGIGAKELQVKKGESAANLSMINSGALAMAFPIAKTVAIKDACDHFGALFGSDLNRKDVMNISTDEKLKDKINPIDKINAEISKIPDTVKEKTSEIIPKIDPSEAFDAPETHTAGSFEQAINEVAETLRAPGPPPIIPNDEF